MWAECGPVTLGGRRECSKIRYLVRVQRSTSRCRGYIAGEELDNLIREEHQAATTKVFLANSELRYGAQPFQHDSYSILLPLTRALGLTFNPGSLQNFSTTTSLMRTGTPWPYVIPSNNSQTTTSTSGALATPTT